MWLKRNRADASKYVSAFEGGRMKPFLLYCATEIGKTNKIMSTSLNHIELVQAQARREAFREIMKLGKEARRYFNRETR